MFSKNYFRILTLISVSLAGSVGILAQTASVTGKVLIKKADGTTAPATGGTVDVFRTDMKASLPSAKINKKGEFAFAGLPLGATFVLSMSSPGASPNFIPNVKAGMQDITMTLNEGDGKRLTEDEVRQTLSKAPTAAAGDVPRQPTEEEKKAAAEYEKKLAEVAAKNKETESKNTIIAQSLKEGNDAFNAKNYDLAVAKWTEGINADPTYVGSAPILLNNKGTALKIMGVDYYNRAVKSADATEKADLLAKAKASRGI
jgi:hypothetical protein